MKESDIKLKIKELENELEKLKEEKFRKENPIKSKILDLKKKQKEENEYYFNEIQKVVNRCKHKYEYYEYELNNYDQDVVTGAVCSECDNKISGYEYKELMRKGLL